MSDVLLELYRHTTWATLCLIEHCRGLPDEHLDATMPGTFGTIRETLRHLVNSEESYFLTVTGERLAAPLRDGPAPLDDLAERIRRLGPRWEALSEDGKVPSRDVVWGNRWRMAAAIPMAQAIHHAEDHRGNILSILGARGLKVPELSVWSYAQSAGHMHPVQPSPGA